MTPPALARALTTPAELSIAVSGGVDSMTLAHVAQCLRASVRMIHAISPAVPAEATTRVQDHAARHGWRLCLIDAGEFDDPRYRANPLERCYFCKTNLYGTIARMTEGTIASGTNLDDLSDFRPGLRAAQEHGVIHPFVTARIDKAAVRALAMALGLDGLSELAAQPCLASRVETGLRVEPAALALIDRVEATLRARLGAGAVVRLRLTAQGAILEHGGDCPDGAALAGAATTCRAAGLAWLGHRPYRRGAAFLHGAAT